MEKTRESVARRAIRSRRIATEAGFVDGFVVVENGKISAIRRAAEGAGGAKIYDVANLVVLPGLVDTHVHINEPGRTDWEGYETATRAAAAGGITTLVDMPLNCIPVTTSVKALETKLEALSGKLTVDCGFYGGFVPGNETELLPMAKRGVLGFKAFMVHSGIDDFPQVTAADLKRGMPIIANARVPLLAHAELESTGKAPVLPPQSHPEPYARYLASRPQSMEDDAVGLLVKLCQESRCRTHVVHLSSASALPLLKDARRMGLPISAETCPHYLTFASEEIADGDTRFKCAPPIREMVNREQLWRGLETGAIDFVVSDHSPCAPHLKLMERGDFENAWGGIAGLQFGMAAVWAALSTRGGSPLDIAKWMAAGPAALVGLDRRKGRIAVGRDADLVVFDPDKHFAPEASMILHRHKVTPYAGRPLRGNVEATFVRGSLVYERGQFFGPPCGQPVLKDW